MVSLFFFCVIIILMEVQDLSTGHAQIGQDFCVTRLYIFFFVFAFLYVHIVSVVSYSLCVRCFM